MNLKELRELLTLRPRAGDQVSRALRQCYLVEDVRLLARHRLPRAVFDYVDGGAEEEVTLAANRDAYRGWTYQPRSLRDVSTADLSVKVFGRVMAAPLGLAPTGFTRMIHPAGELAVAAAAARRELPYALSTVGTTSIEGLAATGHSDLWFQVYVLRDRDLTRSLIERAAAAGFTTLEIAVDTPVSSRRIRDLRNGLTIPPQLNARTLLGIGRRFRYWTAMLASPPLEFANLGDRGSSRRNPSAVELADLYDPSVDWTDIASFRQIWKGSLLLKGPVSPDDARKAEDHGVDGLHLSNHGGRQLDRCVSSLELARKVRQVVSKDTTVVVDSGIRHGADIATALALGADLCMVGRPYLYGLAAAGERGVLRVIDLLTEQLRVTMQLLGVTTISELRECAAELLVRHRAEPD